MCAAWGFGQPHSAGLTPHATINLCLRHRRDVARLGACKEVRCTGSQRVSGCELVVFVPVVVDGIGTYPKDCSTSDNCQRKPKVLFRKVELGHDVDVSFCYGVLLNSAMMSCYACRMPIPILFAVCMLGHCNGCNSGDGEKCWVDPVVRIFAVVTPNKTGQNVSNS